MLGEFFEDNPLHDYIQNNYSVVNSDDTFYIVTKWSGSYPQSIDISKTFHGNPADGGRWQPHVFDSKNASNNPERSNKFILGAIAPLWNDYGANASVYSEVYYAWREGIPALADKQWGGDLTEDEFHQVFPVLHASIPGQNLDRAIPSKTSTILHYDSGSWTSDSPHSDSDTENEGSRKRVRDKSGNEYTGTTNCKPTKDGTLRITPDCTLRTPLRSKGRDYTLSIKLKLDSDSLLEDTTILSGADSSLMLTPAITLFASGNYYRLNSTLPQDKWVDLTVTSRGERTFASIREATPDPPPSSLDLRGSATEEEFQAILGISGERFVWAPIAIEAPIAELGGDWSGELANLFLSSEA
jgi:hexosaminidase